MDERFAGCAWGRQRMSSCRQRAGERTIIVCVLHARALLPLDDFCTHFLSQCPDSGRLASACGTRENENAAILGEFRVRLGRGERESFGEPLFDVSDFARMDREVVLRESHF